MDTASAQQLIATINGEGLGNATPLTIQPLRFLHWSAPEYGYSGDDTYNTVFQFAAIAVANIFSEHQHRIALKAQELGEQWYEHAKKKYDRWEGRFKPLELDLLREVSVVRVRKMDCGSARGRAQSAVGSEFDRARSQGAKLFRRHSLCGATNGTLAHYQSVLYDDTMNYNLGDERWYTDYANDKRWNRRSTVLNLGRNIDSESLKYGDVARTAFGNVSGQIDRAAGAVMGAVGYFGARNDTFYPTSFLGSNGGMNPFMSSTGTPIGSVNPHRLSPAG